MRHARNISFLILVLMLFLLNTTRVGANTDCSYYDGPMQGRWCENQEASCDDYIYRCCGEDMFNSYCEYVDCGIILPPPYGYCCYLNVTCEPLIER